LAEQIAAERVDYLYGKSVRSYEASKGVRQYVRQRVGDGPTTLVKESFGEPKHLSMACRLAMQGGTLPVSTLKSHVRWEDEEFSESEGVTVVEVEDDARQVVEVEASSPPMEDCSVSTTDAEVTSVSRAASEVASPMSTATSVLPLPPASRQKSRTAQTVQPPKEDRNQSSSRRRKAFLAPLEAS
jgi:hypothetical protein